MIQIKSTFANKGTTDWLQIELQDKKLWFAEDMTKDGKLGLFMLHKYGKSTKTMLLATYNPLNMAKDDLENAESFVPLVISGSMSDPLSTENVFNLTPAAIRTVMDIARQWCEYKNAEREKDKELKIEVKFI